jgi:chromosome partitioning protein
VASSHVDLWATEGVLDLAGRERKAAWLVLNRARAGTRLGEEVAAAAAELTAGVVGARLSNRVVYAETLGQGLGVAEAGQRAAKDEVGALTDEVLGLLGV